jgi:predicted nucleotidyltransferase
MVTREKAREKLERLQPNERRALAALVERLRDRFGADLLRVVLFGSKARGDYDDESDMDVLVVARIPENKFYSDRSEIINLAGDIDLEHDVVLSLLIRDEKDYIRMREWNLLLNRNIERDGIVLWKQRTNTISFASG